MTATVTDIGRYHYAPKRFVDYLTARMPDALVCTKIPTNPQRELIVTINSMAAWSSPNPQLSWRQLVFGCHAPTEMRAGELCERVRAEVMYSSSWRSMGRNYVCRKAAIVGEPARFDLLDEPTPRFQVTINVLFREAYRPALPGPPPEPGAGARWFTGTGPPAAVPGAQPGDFYLDADSGMVYRLGEPA
jgi:hypothetical protein